MTLILAFSAFGQSLTLSDRVVSRGKAVVSRTYNKSIHYLADDATFTISYTGLAQIKNEPTDDWIARSILGENFENNCASLNRHNIAPNRLSSVANKVVMALKNAIKSDKYIYENYLEIVFSGTMLYGPVLLPLLFTVKTPRKSNKLAFSKKRFRYFYEKRNFNHLYASGGYDKEEPEMYDNLRESTSHLSENGDSTTWRGPLVSVLKEFSKKYPSIGDEAMTIFESRNRRESVIQFEPIRKELPKNIIGELLNGAQQTYTPWIIYPNGYMPPMHLMGVGSELSLSGGQYRVKFKMREESSKIKGFYMGVADRFAK